MNAIVAPPGIIPAVVYRTDKWPVFAEQMLLLGAVYSEMTAKYGPGWYFKEYATREKDVQLRPMRSLLNKFCGPSHVILTHETALITPADNVAVVTSPPEEVLASSEARTGVYRFPSLQAAEYVMQYYADWARSNGFGTYDTFAQAWARFN